MNSVFNQYNQDMLQTPRYLFSAHQVNVAPFTTDQGYGKNETQALDFNQCMAPIRNQTQSTTVTQYNASNLNPRTYQGGNVKAMIPYGYARGQLSLLTNLEENAPGEMLIMSNAPVFQQVARQERPAFVPPSTV
jgi:hypothetical protein